jgi:hypothetical protein
VSLHNVASLPFTLLNRGQLGAAGVLFFFYAVIAKRIVPAHWEWETRGRYVTRAYVKEFEILDLIIEGRKMTYRPIPWIMERTTANSTEPVQFKAARFNSKIYITKFKYL